jgi:hypothetical protein
MTKQDQCKAGLVLNHFLQSVLDKNAFDLTVLFNKN